ncbi:4-hydroxythreonine-4-phosphate dehydrogenase PdxA [Limnoglobus roseus]|uniref:4-hydroxythreonine-4-phosphate dehydrogenase PdxA n=1 Tax=Limnoglobus roseus TaxID=2598579 RepID=A0A5C1AHD2_9BACT|nr:4-hydroxythreonine-4-phosphate dehydrogenase PdxA [Limnoglobus roseus]QEL18230.1 4-hydroxythreonine-4-phosphate dehydrogenase PdxA [Limnoglobus roseus]
MTLPRLLITLGDVAGIGPEIVAKAWPELAAYCQPLVIGDPAKLPADIPCHNPSSADLSRVPVGAVTAEAGRAAYDWLVYAIDECLANRADGIVTCPLHKEGLHAANIHYPGHTEILADRTGTTSFAMLLYDDALPLAVAHVTLHRALSSVFEHITPETVLGKIRLLHDLLPKLTGQPARIGVAALNPHASDGGLFGHEEATIIAPAVAAACREGISVHGPIASDAIFLPHNRARFDGVVAMYHDQGHIAMKLLGGRRAVNISAGLPIVRTSVAHGTAYDIAGKGVADPSSLVSAVRVAARLADARRKSLHPA